jgi:TP901 family phage tail tape measure protein
MAGKNKVSVSIALEGEQQYRQAIQNINSAQKTLRSEMKTVEQQFKTSANSLEALTSKQNVLQRQYEQQAQKVKVYEQALENATNKEATAAEKVDKLTKEYEEEQQALDKMRQTMPEATEEIAKQEQKVNDLSNKLSVAQKDYLSAQNATNKYQTSLNYANVELQDLDSELQKNDGYMREAEKSADKTAHSIDQYGNEVKEAEQDTMSFGQTALAVFAGQVLHQALEKLVRGIADISKECVEMGSQFEASMSKVEAVSGATGSDLDALTEKAKEMGSTTMFSASQAADAMNYMAMAGWKTEDMLSGIEGVMSLAAASGEDLATTSDIVTDALTAFGLTAQDAGHFADVLAAASSNANTNVSMMGETFKYCAPVAGALGFSVEDTAEAIGLMANAGIKGSQAGTSLRRIMQELNGEVKIHSKTMGDVVIQTTNADGSMRELSDILADCRVAFGELSESEKAAAASSIVGKNAMSGFLALMNAAPSDVDKLSSALNNCNGVAKDMADTM